MRSGASRASLPGEGALHAPPRATERVAAIDGKSKSRLSRAGSPDVRTIVAVSRRVNPWLSNQVGTRIHRFRLPGEGCRAGTPRWRCVPDVRGVRDSVTAPLGSRQRDRPIVGTRLRGVKGRIASAVRGWRPRAPHAKTPRREAPRGVSSRTRRPDVADAMPDLTADQTGGGPASAPAAPASLSPMPASTSIVPASVSMVPASGVPASGTRGGSGFK